MWFDNIAKPMGEGEEIFTDFNKSLFSLANFHKSALFFFLMFPLSLYQFLYSIF